MKKLLLACALLLFGALPFAFGQQKDLIKLNFQSKWFPDAQFAGYFVAKDKGYYAAEGLDVTILDGGNVNPTVQVATGNADIGTDWISNMLVQREKGLKVVQIAQMFQKSGYRLVALKDSGIQSFADLPGKTVGVWGFGNEFAAEAIFAKLGLTSDLDPTVKNPDVKTVVYAFDPSLVFPSKVDLASAMTYNELDQIVGLGYDLNRLVILNPADIGADLLEDDMFTTPAMLNSTDFKGSGLSGLEVATRFLRASIKGWEYAIANQKEAVQIMLKYCGDTCAGSGSRQSPLIHQTWMLAEAAKLIKPTPDTKIGTIDKAAFEHSINLLVQVGLLKQPVTYDEVVDPRVLEAVYGSK